ncbi:MAG: hypothetical protein DRI48_06995, partial [Chloroflexi bacterium]
SNTIVVTVTDDPPRYALELWVYPQVVTDTSFILRTDAPTDTAENYSHLLGIRDGYFQHTVYDGVHKTVTGTTPVTVDTWYHLVGTAESGGDIKLYVNGDLEGKLDGVGTVWHSGDWYRLGSAYGPTGTSQYFTGRLDEVAVYSRTLSSGEVHDHYLRGALRLGFQVRACDDSGCDGETFVGPGGFVTTTYSEQSNDSVDLPGVSLTGVPDNRYFQYRVVFETDDPDYSPELRRVRVWPDHRLVIPSQGTCDADARAFTCDLGDMAAGGVITVTAHADVHPSARGVVTNTAVVSSTSLDADPTDDRALATTTVGSEVYLSVAKFDDDDEDGYWWHSGSADPVNPGFPMTYTLEVHNGGPSTAWDVWVTDTLPITATGVSAYGDWATCQFVTHAITCTTDSLGPYTWRRILITGTAPATVGLITNTAWITARASSVYTTSHVSDTQVTTIDYLADLVISKSSHPDPINPGETLTYTIAVTNTGPSTAVNVTVTDTHTLPPDLVVHPLASSDWSCSAPGSQVVCTLLHPLTPTHSASFNLTATAPLSGLIGDVAVAASETTDPRTDDNTVFYYATVRPTADLFIYKDDVKDPVNAAAPLTYTLSVTNAGPVSAGVYTTSQEFANPHRIGIPWSGRAHPYPSTLHIGGVPGVIGDLTVRLHGFSHDYPADVSALLVGPTGRSVVLMSNAGGGADANDVTLNFNDAGIRMPLSDTLTSTVTYRPTNYGISGEFYTPAPSGPYGGSLSNFIGTSPNGLWRLYVMDTMEAIGGEIARGWSLHLTATTADVVTVTDHLPAGLTGVHVTSPVGWACDAVTDTWTCVANYLAVETPAVFTITATSPITGGVITNTAVVTSTTIDPHPPSNRVQITTTVNPVADLSIGKRAPSSFAYAASTFTYTLHITNSGPSAATAVTVTDVVSGGAELVSAAGLGWNCSAPAPPHEVLTCTGGTILSGTAPVIVVTVTMPTASGPATGAGRKVVTNTAWITGATTDVVTTNNSAFVTTTILSVADVGIDKRAIPAIVAPGDLITYRLTFTNHGPNVATGVVITDRLPGEIISSVLVSSGANITRTPGTTYTWQVADLAAGEGGVITITGVVSAGLGTITNTAVITGAVEDPFLPNNTVTLATLINRPPIADAGPDQTVSVGSVVELDGSASTDPDGHLPLSYGWRQTGGAPAVVLSSAVVSRPTFTAPGTPTRLTFTLTVTDALGMGSAPDAVVVTIGERPIT